MHKMGQDTESSSKGREACDHFPGFVGVVTGETLCTRWQGISEDTTTISKTTTTTIIHGYFSHVAEVEVGQHAVDLEGLRDRLAALRAELVGKEDEGGQHPVDHQQCVGQRFAALGADLVRLALR